jgi:hypothetical protein
VSNEEKDNMWKYFALFILAWFAFFGLVLPLLDEYTLGFAWKKFLCDNNLIFQTSSSIEWCKIK